MQNQPQQPSEQEKPGKRRRQRLRLPFEPRRSDPGEWSYDHRAGICITLILYLVIAIGFMWSKIEVGANRAQGTILIDFPDEERPQALTEEERERIEQMLDDMRDVRNLASNENSQLDAQLRDSKGTDASQLYEDAGALDEQMRANREAYEEGLRKVENMRSERRPNDASDGQTPQNTKVQGRVTVSFSFDDPVRSSVNLVVPAYRCEGGGEVVVSATLDQSGYVTSATVDRSSSSADNCMRETAVSAAMSSRFNTDNSAPVRHKGTIKYIFVPQ